MRAVHGLHAVVSRPLAIDLFTGLHGWASGLVAAKHLGYNSLSGASDKVLGSLGHYGLLEKAGKGQVRVSQTAVDILHPVSPEDKKRALHKAAFSPSIFGEIRTHFSDGLPSEAALKSWLMREEFLDRAILPVMKAYLGTCQYLEQEKAIENGGPSPTPGDIVEELDGPEVDGQPTFGGARVGDLIQWECNGVLRMEAPMRVRLVTDDGQWVAVEGSETGIPMSEVIVQERAPAAMPPPPSFKLAPDFSGRDEPSKPLAGEAEWISNVVGRGRKVRLLVSGGDMGPKEITKLITLLQAQKAVLDDDDEEDGAS